MYTLETSNMKKICLFSSIFMVRARRVVKRLNKLDHAHTLELQIASGEM